MSLNRAIGNFGVQRISDHVCTWNQFLFSPLAQVNHHLVGLLLPQFIRVSWIYSKLFSTVHLQTWWGRCGNSRHGRGREAEHFGWSPAGPSWNGRTIFAGRAGPECSSPFADFWRASAIHVQPARICLGHAPLLRADVLPTGAKCAVSGDEPWAVRYGSNRGKRVFHSHDRDKLVVGALHSKQCSCK